MHLNCSQTFEQDSVCDWQKSWWAGEGFAIESPWSLPSVDWPDRSDCQLEDAAGDRETIRGVTHWGDSDARFDRATWAGGVCHVGVDLGFEVTCHDVVDLGGACCQVVVGVAGVCHAVVDVGVGDCHDSVVAGDMEEKFTSRYMMTLSPLGCVQTGEVDTFRVRWPYKKQCLIHILTNLRKEINSRKTFVFWIKEINNQKVENSFNRVLTGKCLFFWKSIWPQNICLINKQIVYGLTHYIIDPL